MRCGRPSARRLYSRGTRAKATSFWASEVPCEAGPSAELGRRVLAAQGHLGGYVPQLSPPRILGLDLRLLGFLGVKECGGLSFPLVQPGLEP